MDKTTLICLLVSTIWVVAAKPGKVQNQPKISFPRKPYQDLSINPAKPIYTHNPVNHLQPVFFHNPGKHFQPVSPPNPNSHPQPSPIRNRFRKKQPKQHRRYFDLYLLHAIKAAVKELIANVRELTDRADMTDETLEEVQSNIQQLQTSVNDLETDVDELEEDNERLQNKTMLLETVNMQQQMQIIALQDKDSELMSDIGALNNSVQATEMNVTSLRSDTTNLIWRVDSNIQDIIELSVNVTEIANQLEQAQEDVNALNNTCCAPPATF